MCSLATMDRPVTEVLPGMQWWKAVRYTAFPLILIRISRRRRNQIACVMYSLNLVKPTPADYVLIYGAGPIGLTYIKALKAFGIEDFAVIAKGKARVKQARECGAGFVIDIEEESVADRIRDQWGGGLADVVIDAVGRGSVLTEAVHLLNSRGRIMLFGLDHNAMASVPPAVYTQKELTMYGALERTFRQLYG